MQDRPTSQELLQAVAQFLNSEVAPTLGDARLRFRMLVAVNVLNVVARELQLDEEQLRAEYERLKGLVGNDSPKALTPNRSPKEGGDRENREDLRGQVERMTRELAAKIRAGEADEGNFHDAVFAHVEQTVNEKLEIANPRYLAKRGD